MHVLKFVVSLFIGTQVLIGASYNPSKAVEYAHNYTISDPSDCNTWVGADNKESGWCPEVWNGEYSKRYGRSDEAYGTDCMHFVSQALHAGGVSMDREGGSKDNLDVWYNDGGETWATNSWVSVSLFKARIDNGYFEDFDFKSIYPSEAKAGDIIFINNNGHIMLVTGATENGKIMHTAHTNDRYDKLFTYTSSNCFVYRITPKISTETLIVETMSVTNITDTSATVHGKIINSEGVVIDERRFDWGVEDSSGHTTNYTANVEVSNNNFSYTITGLIANRVYQFRSWAHEEGKSQEEWSSSELSYFTTNEEKANPVLEYYSYRIDDNNGGESEGNDDDIVNPSEKIELDIKLKNTGLGNANNVQAILSSSDSCLVEISDDTEEWDFINTGDIEWSNDDYDFEVSSSCEDGHIINFNLAITSDEGSWNDSFSMTVYEEDNEAPLVSLGNDRTIIEGETITLYCEASDSDGSISSYQWFKDGAPLGNLGGNDGLGEDVGSIPNNSIDVGNSLSIGTYIYTCQATDNDGAIGSGSLTVTVNPKINQVPVVNVGSDKSIKEGETTSFYCQANDSDGNIASYQWFKDDVSVGNKASYTVSTSMELGSYIYTCKATDNEGAIGSDSLTLSIESEDDNYESNNIFDDAYDLSQYNGEWLNTINGYGMQLDTDYYKIYISTSKIDIQLEFIHNEGDIDLILWNKDKEYVATSGSINDNESIHTSISEVGIYYIEVSNGNEGNRYNLLWTDGSKISTPKVSIVPILYLLL